MYAPDHVIVAFRELPAVPLAELCRKTLRISPTPGAALLWARDNEGDVYLRYLHYTAFKEKGVTPSIVAALHEGGIPNCGLNNVTLFGALYLDYEFSSYKLDFVPITRSIITDWVTTAIAQMGRDGIRVKEIDTPFITKELLA